MHLQVQSTMGTVKLEEVRAAGEGAPLMMFQLYVIKEREFTQRLIQGPFQKLLQKQIVPVVLMQS